MLRRRSNTRAAWQRRNCVRAPGAARAAEPGTAGSPEGSVAACLHDRGVEVGVIDAGGSGLYAATPVACIQRRCASWTVWVCYQRCKKSRSGAIAYSWQCRVAPGRVGRHHYSGPPFRPGEISARCRARGLLGKLRGKASGRREMAAGAGVAPRMPGCMRCTHLVRSFRASPRSSSAHVLRRTTLQRASCVPPRRAPSSGCCQAEGLALGAARASGAQSPGRSNTLSGCK